MKATLFSFILFFGIHSYSFGQSAPEEIIYKYVAKMNGFFGLQIPVKASKECGFRFDYDESNEFAFLYCPAELVPFKEYRNQEISSSLLKFILSHEYAHVLINNQVSEVGIKLMIERQRKLSEAIPKKASQDPLLAKIFSQLQQFSSEQSGQEVEPGETVEAYLSIMGHENIDSLGVKIMFMLGEKPIYEPFKYYIEIKKAPVSPLAALVYRSRDRTISISINEGLKKWNSFHCTDYVWSDEESASALKKIALNNDYSEILLKLTEDCSLEEVENSFFRSAKQFLLN